MFLCFFFILMFIILKDIIRFFEIELKLFVGEKINRVIFLKRLKIKIKEYVCF